MILSVNINVLSSERSTGATSSVFGKTPGGADDPNFEIMHPASLDQKAVIQTLFGYECKHIFERVDCLSDHKSQALVGIQRLLDSGTVVLKT